MTAPFVPSTIGPTAARNLYPMDIGDSDFIRALKKAGLLADQAMSSGVLSNTLPGQTYRAAKGIGGGLVDEVGNVVDAVKNVNTPGAGGRESVFNAAFPLLAGLMPMGRGARVAETAVAEALPKGAVTAYHAAEREIGRDALGNAITNRARTIRDPLPPAPPLIDSEAERLIGRNTDGVLTNRGRMVREQARPPRPTIEREVAEVAAYDDLVGAGLTPDVARATIQAERKSSSQLRNGGNSLVVRGRAEDRNALTALRREGHAYRGMTETEYDATLGTGKGVQSRRDYSHSSEGTSFADTPDDAESYVNFGRDDPRKTGKPNYLVEVRRDRLVIDKRDGYPKASGEIPPEDVTRIWRMERDADGNVVAALVR